MGCPVLIIQRREPPNYFFEDVDSEHHLVDTRLLTRDLPEAQLVLLEGSSMMITSDPAATSALAGFLREVDPADQDPTGVGGAPVRTIMFTDVVGHTEMMQRLGDARGRDVLRDHERITRNALATHGGGEVKTMGDGFLATFASTQRALECAAVLQRTFRVHPGEPLSVRIGINSGESVDDDSDIFGSSVIAAARIGAQANGGQILVSDVLRQLVAGKGFVFDDLGECDLKGMYQPVRVWELDWAEAD